MTAAALRRLGPQDRKAARALLRPAFTRYAHALGREPSPEGYRGLDRALDPASGRAWGFEADGRLLAGAFVEFRDGGAWELERLAALPEATGRGFGARLLHHVEAEARAMHAPRIALV
ncbi:MAG: GNAT family N-acetyltransferase, partial [Pseudomonadota bacterium]